MARVENRGLGYQVHDSGDHTLDGIFRLIQLGEEDEPLEAVLTAMCGDIAKIARADVASVYVREAGPDSERFTMRGNVGFPADAVGRVHLGRGEGITGFAADRLRPVSVAEADRDERFKYIPGLGEEQFPALLAVPVLRGGAAAGVLVLQRRAATAFTPEEVVLATALAAVINHALERGEGRERERAQNSDRRTVRLSGSTLIAGTAMGRATVLPTLAALAAPTGPARPIDASALDTLWTRLRGELQKGISGGGAAAQEIASLALILDDERFRGRLTDACAAPAPLKAMSELARAYARAPFQAGGDEATSALMGARAAEIEDLCVLAHAAAGGTRLVRAGAMLASERLGLFATAYAISAGASAFVVEGEVPSDGGPAALARAAGRPLISAVHGLFGWLRPEDLLVVDADDELGTGVVRVNPPATTVARFRSASR
ncbi:MAG TPA: GAF domain-containing protein [Polyangia bacterium]|nr:GAF domain-containing protein [Polyangia bacterium]